MNARWWLFVLWTVLATSGCSETPSSSSTADENKVPGDEQSTSSNDTSTSEIMDASDSSGPMLIAPSVNTDPEPNVAAPTHVIAAPTAYYNTGPQQARSPDGTFDAGTKVAVVKQSGSYTLIRSEEGVTAYVSSDALKPIEKGPN